MKVTTCDYFELFNNPQKRIIESVINNFGIKHCILVQNNFFNEKYLKRIFNEYKMVSVMSYKTLLEYLKIGSFFNVNTAIIVKEQKLMKIIKIFQSLNQVSFGN